MNRTLSSTTSAEIVPPLNPSDWFERQVMQTTVERDTAPSAISCFAPTCYEPGYAYPLIVWLHGPCNNEDELPLVMSHISTRNHIAVAPRGTKRILGVPSAYGWDETAAGVIEARERVEECIAVAQQRFNIHPQRIFLAGHSTGGTLACRLGLENPERYAGAVSLSGPVPRGLRLLRNIHRARKLPLLLSVSPTVEHYSTEAVMDDVRFLHSAGMTVDVRLYPDGDDLTDVMFKDLNSWVMDHIRPSGAKIAS